MRTGASVSGPVPLPTEKNVYAVIRGPFKDKDSREHFEIRTHKRLIDILQPTPKTVDSLQRLDHLAGGRGHPDPAHLMAGMLGRKLGMTQVFDPDDGHVERVTVIEAGPCFVTAIRRAERDGYDAIQLAFGEVAEKKLQKARRGHLNKAGVGHLRHLREFRGEAGELELGRRAEGRRRVREGRDRQGRGRLEGQGLRRHDQAPQLPPRARVARLPQRPRARLDRRLRRSGARVQGDPRPRPDGQQARHPARARGRGRAPRREPAVRPRLRAGSRRAASSRSGRTPDGRAPGSVHRQSRASWRSTRASSASASTARSCTRRCAPSWRPAAAARPPRRRAPR